MENQLVNPESTVYKVALTAKLHLIGLYSQSKKRLFCEKYTNIMVQFCPMVFLLTL